MIKGVTMTGSKVLTGFFMAGALLTANYAAADSPAAPQAQTAAKDIAADPAGDLARWKAALNARGAEASLVARMEAIAAIGDLGTTHNAWAKAARRTLSDYLANDIDPDIGEHRAIRQQLHRLDAVLASIKTVSYIISIAPGSVFYDKMMADDVSVSQKDRMLNDLGIKGVTFSGADGYKRGSFVTVDVTSDKAVPDREILKALQAEPAFEAVEPNHPIRLNPPLLRPGL